MSDIQDVEIKTETKRKRRKADSLETLGKKLEAQGYNLEELERDNPYNPTVEVVDLQPTVALTPLEFISTEIEKSGLGKHIAEVHPQFEPDGTCRRVELKGKSYTTLMVEGQGELVWATFTGALDDFPAFLKKITPITTFSV